MLSVKVNQSKCYLKTFNVTGDKIYGGKLRLSSDVVAVVLAEAEDTFHGVVPGAQSTALTQVLFLNVVLPGP